MYKKVQRESGVELLRIVLMFMIIVHHLIGQGLNMQYLGTARYLNIPHATVLLFIDNFLIIAVNCFFFISGFYGIKFKSINLISLIFQSVFYGIAIDLVFKVPLSFHSLVMNLFNVITGEWWFLTCYFFMYLIAPLFNAGIKTLTEAQFIYILIVFFILNTRIGVYATTSYGPILGVSSGYSFFSFAAIYLLGRYIKIYLADKDSFIVKRSFPILLVSLLLNFLLVLCVYHYHPEKMYPTILNYSNPLIVLSAVSFFFCFKKLNFSNAFINSISTCVFGVYLIHVHPQFAVNINMHIMHLFNFNISSFNIVVLYLLGVSFVILSGALFIEKIRTIIFSPVLKFFASNTYLLRLDELLKSS
jgi:hypothetical protein